MGEEGKGWPDCVASIRRSGRSALALVFISLPIVDHRRVAVRSRVNRTIVGKRDDSETAARITSPPLWLSEYEGIDLVWTDLLDAGRGTRSVVKI